MASTTKDVTTALESLAEALGIVAGSTPLRYIDSSGGSIMVPAASDGTDYRPYIAAENGAVVIYDAASPSGSRADWVKFDPVQLAETIVPVLLQALTQSEE